MKRKIVIILAQTSKKETYLEIQKVLEKKKYEVTMLKEPIEESKLEPYTAIFLAKELDVEVKKKLFYYAFTQEKQWYMLGEETSSIWKEKIENWHDKKVYHIKRWNMTRWQRAIKRTADLFLSSLLLILSSPIIVLLMLAIRIESKGPAIFKQKRVGKQGKEFVMYKLRSMEVEAVGEKACNIQNNQIISEDSNKITKVGKVIRKMKLDELPQFVNVLKGEMSMVGPRPELKGILEKIQDIVPEYAMRQKVKPGITGLAHVYGNYQTAIQTRLSYDICYLSDYRLRKDGKIMLLTIGVILKSLQKEKENGKDETVS